MNLHAERRRKSGGTETASEGHPRLTLSPRLRTSPGPLGSGGKPPAGILLMAGRSSRLGSPKALLPFGGRTLIEVVLAQVFASRLSPIVLVLGDHYEAVRQAVVDVKDHPKLIIMRNARFAQGMSTSVRRGLEAVEPSVPAVMFLLGDQPLIRTALIDRLVARFERSGAPIVVPVYGGRPGNPVLFRGDLLPEFQKIRGDAGGRELIKKYESAVLRVPVRPGYLGWDLDTREDYEKISRQFEKIRSRNVGASGRPPGGCRAGIRPDATQ